MRIPYAPNEPPNDNETDKAIYERIKQRRSPRPLLPLDLALLNSPPVADGWNSFLGAIRTKTDLDDKYMELAICRIATLNKAAFEWRSHCPLAITAGVPSEVMKLVKSAPYPYDWFSSDESCLGSADSKFPTVLAYADAMTKEVTVQNHLFEKVKEAFETRHITELTATIAAYNCVSRFLVALDVAEMNGLPVEEWKV